MELRRHCAEVLQFLVEVVPLPKKKTLPQFLELLIKEISNKIQELYSSHENNLKTNFPNYSHKVYNLKPRVPNQLS